jgi:hypothetical protein
MAASVSVKDQLSLLFHPDTTQALLDLSDPTKSMSLRIVGGNGPGKSDIVAQLYPPGGLHRHSFPVMFGIIVGNDNYYLKIMVSMIDARDGGDGLILGFMAYDHWHKICEKTGINIEPQQSNVAIKYNPGTREGVVRLYKEAYAVIATYCKLNIADDEKEFS